MGVEGAGLGGAAVGPDRVQELFLRVDPEGVRGENAEEGELLLRQVDLAVAHRDPAPQRVDHEVADPARPVVGFRAPPQDGADPGAELGVDEGLAF